MIFHSLCCYNASSSIKCCLGQWQIKTFNLCCNCCWTIVNRMCQKETPKEEEQEKVETAVSEPTPAEPAKFESLESVQTEEAQTQEPTQVEVHHEETANTTTEIAVKLALHKLSKIHKQMFLSNLKQNQSQNLNLS